MGRRTYSCGLNLQPFKSDSPVLQVLAFFKSSLYLLPTADAECICGTSLAVSVSVLSSRPSSSSLAVFPPPSLSSAVSIHIPTARPAASGLTLAVTPIFPSAFLACFLLSVANTFCSLLLLRTSVHALTRHCETKARETDLRKGKPTEVSEHGRAGLSPPSVVVHPAILCFLRPSASSFPHLTPARPPVSPSLCPLTLPALFLPPRCDKSARQPSLVIRHSAVKSGISSPGAKNST
ncbi:hypothetical protein IWZ01DRAFT_120734 [Phyllosticta capitalensis]